MQHRMRLAILAPVLPWGMTGLAAQERDTAAPALSVVAGFTDAGTASDQWLTMLRRRMSDADATAFAQLVKPPTGPERAWMALIRSRVGHWEREITTVAGPFQPVAPPAAVLIVAGNRGGEDAFTHDARTIGFDLAALQATYGDAGASGNEARIDRFFRHEYTHLMQKAWLGVHPYEPTTPLGAALAEIWAEGLGNYHSLSDRWRAVDGVPSATASEVLAVLEPRFVARLAALACARRDHAAGLMADLSWGRFDRKWGALPAALWLDRETGGSADAVRAFVLAGPEGVWALAARHLSRALAAVLEEARRSAARCWAG